MTGYIKISATDYEGNPAVSVKTRLSEVGLMDKVALLDGFLQGIHVNPDDVEVVAMLLLCVICFTRATKQRLSRLKCRT